MRPKTMPPKKREWMGTAFVVGTAALLFVDLYGLPACAPESPFDDTDASVDPRGGGGGGGLDAAAVDECASCDDNDANTYDFCVNVVGCAHLAFAEESPTPVRGNPIGGMEYNDRCPAGQVLVGVNGKLGDSFDQIQAICAPVQVDRAAQVTIGAPTTPFPFRGMNNASAPTTNIQCPANNVMLGFSGGAAALLDRLSLKCAPIVVQQNGATFAVTSGTATQTGLTGGDGGANFEPTDCPVDTLVTGAHIQAGGSVDGFGVYCRKPVVTR